MSGTFSGWRNGPNRFRIEDSGQTLDLVDEGLPETLRFRPAWREVKDMLVTAAETKTGRAVEQATTLLEHALADEGWLMSCKKAR